MDGLMMMRMKMDYRRDRAHRQAVFLSLYNPTLIHRATEHDGEPRDVRQRHKPVTTPALSSTEQNGALKRIQRIHVGGAASAGKRKGWRS